MKGSWFKRRSCLAVLLMVLSFGSYVAHVLYMHYSYKQYVFKVHQKGYVAHMYQSFKEPRNKTGEDFHVDDIPIYSTYLLDYIKKIETKRSTILSKAKSVPWPSISPNYELIDGYDKNFFASLKKNTFVETVFLAARERVAQKIVPVKKYFDFGSSDLGCKRMVDEGWAVYFNGFQLYNKSCWTDLRKTLVPSTIDRKSLSVGLPFQLSSQHKAPTGHSASDVILTFIHIVENGLVSMNGDVFSRNICIKTQRCHKLIHLPLDPSNVPMYDEVFTITEQGAVWYYHMTLEDLPRLAPYVVFLQKNPQIKIHISLAGYHVEMLAALGFGTDRLIWGDARARVVYLPAGTTCGRPSAFNTPLLSLLLRRKVEQKIGKQEQDTIVILERSDTFRQFKYHNEIYQAVSDLAKQHNLKVEVFSDKMLPSLKKGMEMFYRAKAVIGPHGSGMANIVFTKPGTIVIEGLCYMESYYKLCWKGFLPWLCIKPSVRFSLTFRNVAAVLGLHYYGMVRKDDCLYTSPKEVIEPLKFYLENQEESSPFSGPVTSAAAERDSHQKNKV